MYDDWKKHLLMKILVYKFWHEYTFRCYVLYYHIVTHISVVFSYRLSQLGFLLLWWKHHAQMKFGEERVNYILQLSGNTPSWREGRAGTWKQEPNQMHCLLVCSSWFIYTACFLTAPEITSWGWHCPPTSVTDQENDP